mgnify:CR=1 FL=1
MYLYIYIELQRLLGSAKDDTRKLTIKKSLNDLDSRSTSLYRQDSRPSSASPIEEGKNEDGMHTPPPKTLSRSYSDSLNQFKDNVGACNCIAQYMCITINIHIHMYIHIYLTTVYLTTNYLTIPIV